MRIVVASTTVPLVDGGGRLIVRWTAEALRAAGHEVEEFLPFPPGVNSTLPALIGLRRMPFRSTCDRLITIRWPGHVLQHDNKAVWFIHHYRQVFDLWDSPYREVPDNAEGRSFRELLRTVDNAALRETRDLFTNSLIVRDRVREFNGLEALPLFPARRGHVQVHVRRLQ